jgi:hypothetical protein
MTLAQTSNYRIHKGLSLIGSYSNLAKTESLYSTLVQACTKSVKRGYSSPCASSANRMRRKSAHGVLALAVWLEHFSSWRALPGHFVWLGRKYYRDTV